MPFLKRHTAFIVWRNCIKLHYKIRYSSTNLTLLEAAFEALPFGKLFLDVLTEMSYFLPIAFGRNDRICKI